MKKFQPDHYKADGNNQNQETAYSIRKQHILSLSLLVVTAVWFLNGYFLATTGLYKPEWIGICTGIICGALIYAVEKIIILTVKGGLILLIFRSVIAVSVAVIGSAGADLVIFQRDIDKRIDFMKDQQGDSLSNVLDKKYLEDKKLYITDAKEKRNLWLKQVDNYRSEITGNTGRPGVDKIALAELDLANTLKSESIEADKAVLKFTSDHEKHKKAALDLARSDFNDGLVLRLRILHGIIFEDIFTSVFGIAVTLVFLGMELLTLMLKSLLPKSAKELREETIEHIAREQHHWLRSQK
ncbi:MAG TPA: DUF4407 domain-containing protein [Dyadobacter sp.]|jgi:hypothetical protein|nr:DUF4407 domain-containing protein [Dyadobacter sp.]